MSGDVSLQAMWLHRTEAARLRRVPDFRGVTPLDRAKLPVLPGLRADPDDVALVLAALQGGRRTPLSDVRPTRRADGAVVPSIAVIEVTVEPAFAPVEKLRATIAAALPFAHAAPALQAAIDGADELLALPELLAAADSLDSHAARIRAAFARTRRELRADHLETLAQRALIENRHYDMKVMFGAPHIRLELSAIGSGGSGVRLLGGIEASASPYLPLAARFLARALVEVHAHQGADAERVAVRVLAIGRLIGAEQG
jgi:hypothetical protein